MNGARNFHPTPRGGDPKFEGRCLAWQKALLCIDLQFLNCRDGVGVFADHAQTGIPEEAIRYYLDEVEKKVIPNTARLQEAFREQGHEVIHVRIQCLTPDGRDRSLEHKQLGLLATPDSIEARFMPEVAPEDGEIVLNKTASGVFLSTNVEYVLHNLCVADVFVAGVYTNECISSAVRSASDLGFQVYLVADATAAVSHELHEATLLTVKDRFARVVTTEEAIALLRESGE